MMYPPAVQGRFLDAMAIVLLVGAGVAFWVGARSMSARQDLQGLYWLAVGMALLWTTSAVARGDRKA